MKAVALRGVCIGVDRHLQPGDEAEIDPATHQFLAGIGAIAPAEEPAADEAEPVKAEPSTKGAKAPKKGT